LRISALRAFAVADDPLAAADVAFMERETIPATTMRHHLHLLADAGLLREVGRRSFGSRGRPAQRYVLSDLGEEILPLLRSAAAAVPRRPQQPV
jgi:predicted ArsR family transcriptional regulator